MPIFLAAIFQNDTINQFSNNKHGSEIAGLTVSHPDREDFLNENIYIYFYQLNIYLSTETLFCKTHQT